MSRRNRQLRPKWGTATVFVVRMQCAAERRPNSEGITDPIRHLRPDGVWHAHDAVGCQLAWCTGRGLSPIVAMVDEFSWCLAYGTPSRPGGGLLNEDELRILATDTLACEGSSPLLDCEGLFAFVIFDGRRPEITVLTDRSGMIPVYLSEDSGGVWLSSSPLAIACLRPVTLCSETLACLTTAGYCLRDLSLFEEVRRIGPGSQVRYNGERTTRTTWWTPGADPLKFTNVADLAMEIASSQKALLARRLSSSDRVLASLTAGLDSRCACALIRDIPAPITFFTAEGGASWEVPGAEAVASSLGLSWFCHYDSPSHEDLRSVTLQSAILSDGENQPFRGTSHWSFSLGASGTTILWGLGGEVWRDYWSKQEKVALLLRGTDAIERLVRYRMRGSGVPEEAFAPEFRIGMRRHVLDLLRKTFGEMPYSDPRDKLDALYIMERVRRWASVHMMTSGWWALPELPLLGQRILDIAYRLPRELKRSSELMRWVIRSACPEAAQQTHNQGYYSCPRAFAGVRDRWRGLWLDGKALSAKLGLSPRRGRPANAEGRATDVVSYRDLFEDLVRESDMRSAFLYDSQALRSLTTDQLDRPVGTCEPLNFIIGIEEVVRAARRLRTG